jgi:tRNA A-37 threonylcarbamoyl transferase component Bud32
MPVPPSSALPLDQLIGVGRSAEVYRYGVDHVLKLYKVPWEPTAVVNEFKAASQAYRHGLSTPEPMMVLERDGRTGIVFERLEGGTLLDAGLRHPLNFLHQVDRLVQMQQAINAHEVEDLPYQEEVARFQIGGARVSDCVKRAALATLEQLPRGTRLCHGDLHLENVICSNRGLSAVDWQKATAGHPAGDVARTALMLRYGSLNVGGLARYLPLNVIRAALARFYVERYCQLSGISRCHVSAWMLPVMVMRLFGQVAANEDEVREAAERLSGQAERGRLICRQGVLPDRARRRHRPR